MIVDDCKTLSARVSEYKRLRENSVQVGRFEKVRAVLETGTARIAPLAATARTLREANVANVDLGQEAKEVLATLGKARAAFADRPESLIDPRVLDLTKLGKAIEGLAKQLEERLRAEWLQHTAARIPATKREVLDVLAPAFPKEVRLLRQRAEKLELSRHTLPTTQEALSEFESEVVELQQAWAKVGGGNVPPAVTSFLQAAASHAGASLELLTDEVRRWLAEHKIIALFSIKVSN
jgi:hypothetical protein